MASVRKEIKEMYGEEAKMIQETDILAQLEKSEIIINLKGAVPYAKLQELINYIYRTDEAWNKKFYIKGKNGKVTIELYEHIETVNI